MSSYKIGMNLRVTENSNQGGRRYMEDTHSIRFVKNDEGGFEFAYFGIFDGHGGAEASRYARDHLLNEITKYDSFWSNNDEDVLYAIKSGFLDTHFGMWKQLDKWPRTASGFPSTSGTTASICIIKNSKLYIGHVGDSGIVLGYDDSRSDKYIRPKAVTLTTDHKPDSPTEKKRIEDCGGQVVAKSGVQRVVWNRPQTVHKGPIRRSTTIDKIPFLAVARSLGDLWSYNYLNEQFVVSPEPDVSVHPLSPSKDKCLVIGSDGLWNMLSAEEAVSMVIDLEYQFEYKVVHDPNVPVSYWINPAERLVNRALGKWRARLMKADNTSCIVVLIDPLGPRKLTILKKKREEQLHLKEKKSGDGHHVSSAKETSPRKHAPHASPKKSPAAKSAPPKIGNDPKAKGGVPNWNDINLDVKVVTDSPEEKRADARLFSMGNELDDSVQAISAHTAHGSMQQRAAKGQSPNKNKPALVHGHSGQIPTRTSPLQRSSCENVGMFTRHHQLKSRTSPSVLDRDHDPSSVNSSVSSRVNPVNQGSQKCLQPSKQSVENVRNGSKTLPRRRKDVENMFTSKDVKIRLRNLNTDKKIKRCIEKNSKNSNNSSFSEARSAKKKTTRSLSSRISLRLRRIRQKSLRARRSATPQIENKILEVPSFGVGIKRKLEAPQGAPVMKKMKH